MGVPVGVSVSRNWAPAVGVRGQFRSEEEEAAASEVGFGPTVVKRIPSPPGIRKEQARGAQQHSSVEVRTPEAQQGIMTSASTPASDAGDGGGPSAQPRRRQEPPITFDRITSGLSGLLSVALKALAFAKRQEIWVDRVAMLAFLATLIGEGVTGKGPMGQLGIDAGLPLYLTPPLVLAFSLVVTFTPKTPSAGKNKKGIDFAGLGFTESNENLHGRAALLGFAASFVGELLTGRGPVGQLSMETGIPEAYIVAAPLVIAPWIYLVVTRLKGKIFPWE